MRLRRRRGPTSFDDALDAYQLTRPASHRASVCNAPSNNLYFRADGAVAPCWLQFHLDSPHWSPDGPGIREIWQGEQLRALRGRLATGELTGACTTCRDDIIAGTRPLAAAYDEIGVGGTWPRMFELELSNHCNLECVMCSGMLSSRIRANREQLPPLEVPYDSRFVDQLVEFLPHLDELRVNGGEPLLQPLVFELLDRVAELRPELKVTIATNGTVRNSKVDRLLERNAIHFNVSVDSLVKERYESIRVHGRLEVVMRNLEHFVEYSHRTDRLLCVMVNPMRTNWDELGDYVRWCNERDVALWFNTVRYPEHVALATLPADELEHIRSTLLGDRPVIERGELEWLHRRNLGVYERFRDTQLPAWIAAAGAAPDGGDAHPVTLTARRRRAPDAPEPGADEQ